MAEEEEEDKEERQLDRHGSSPGGASAMLLRMVTPPGRGHPFEPGGDNALQLKRPSSRTQCTKHQFKPG